MALGARLPDCGRVRFGFVPLPGGDRRLHRLDFLARVLRPERRLRFLRLPERFRVGERLLQHGGVLAGSLGVRPVHGGPQRREGGTDLPHHLLVRLFFRVQRRREPLGQVHELLVDHGGGQQRGPSAVLRNDVGREIQLVVLRLSRDFRRVELDELAHHGHVGVELDRGLNRRHQDQHIRRIVLHVRGGAHAALIDRERRLRKNLLDRGVDGDRQAIVRIRMGRHGVGRHGHERFGRCRCRRRRSCRWRLLGSRDGVQRDQQPKSDGRRAVCGF